MNKELKEILKDLHGVLDELLRGDKEALKNRVDKIFTEAMEEKASIEITKHEDGRAETKIEGNALVVLMTLAGLEKTILNEYNVPSEVWEIIKDAVGSKEVKVNE